MDKAAQQLPPPVSKPVTIAERDLKAGRLKSGMHSADELEACARTLAAWPHSKLLIIGGRTTNLQRGARDHPRVLCWESTAIGKAHRDGLPPIPRDVRAIVMTRWNSHRTMDHLMRQLPYDDTRPFVFGGLKSTGEIRHVLASVFPDILSTPEPVSIKELQSIRLTLATEPDDESADGLDALIDDAIDALETAQSALLLVRESIATTRVERASLRRLKESLVTAFASIDL